MTLCGIRMTNQVNHWDCWTDADTAVAIREIVNLEPEMEPGYFAAELLERSTR